ncbi:MAG: hypothetical protein J7K68_01355 [Candidatus Diapherotrites archaeon]|nr:hypothetical protein [Candidatus Diapherotrites archaeon]
MKLMYTLIGIILILAGALAVCYYADFETDSFVQVKQFETATVLLRIQNECGTTEHFKISARTDVPLTISPNDFYLREGDSKLVSIVVEPGTTDGGLYESTINIVSDEVMQRSIAIKVIPNPNRMLRIYELPTTVRTYANYPYPVLIGIENNANMTLKNTIIVAEVNGEKVYQSEPIDLRPGERALRTFNLNLQEGTYTVRVKAFSGSYETVRGFEVISSKANRISTSLMISERDSAYILRYKLTNNDRDEIKNLLLTVEDAPVTWEVVKPPRIDLKPNETATVELVLKHDEDANANITVAFYEGSKLIQEEKVELNLEEVRGATGLISFRSSLTLGTIFLLLAGIAYYLYKRRK